MLKELTRVLNPEVPFNDLPALPPPCRINTVSERCDVSRQTASLWLRALVEAGLLSDVKVGRERLFVNDEFLNVLTRVECGKKRTPRDTRATWHKC